MKRHNAKIGLFFSLIWMPLAAWGATFTVSPSAVSNTYNGAITLQIGVTTGETVVVQKFLDLNTNGIVDASEPLLQQYKLTDGKGSPTFGSITNGTTAPATNAVVIVFPPPRAGHGLGNPVASTVADSSGNYSIQLPAGGYSLLAGKIGYLANSSALPSVTLSGGQSTNANMTVSAATNFISGKIVDATNSSLGIAAGFLNAKGGNYISVGFAASNGNFTLPVNSGSWSFGTPNGIVANGYCQYDNGTNANAGTTNLISGFYKATAAFYGTVKDNLGNPVPGVSVDAQDGNNGFYTDGFTDINGNYVAGAVGGISGDLWQPQIDKNPTNYVFSQSPISTSGGTNLSAGQAVQANFTAILATNLITGRVQDNYGNSIVGVGVNAYATISGLTYNVGNADTDTNGNYSLNVSGGNWYVNLNCGCTNCSDGLSSSYQCPSTVFVAISGSNGVANFTVQSCSGVQIGTTSVPSGTVGDYYSTQFYASSCYGNLNWSVNDPQDVPPGLTLYSSGAFNGTPTTSGNYNFTVNVTDGNGNSANQGISLYIAPAASPLQINTATLPNGTNGAHYSQTLQASGGTVPYSWKIAQGSAALPSGLTLATNGLLSGTPVQSVTNYPFIAEVTDAASSNAFQVLALTIYGASSNTPVSLTSAKRLSNGQFQFGFYSSPGVNYTLQYSTNLSNWNSIVTINGQGGAETIGSGPVTNSRAAFYRLKIGP